RGVVRASLWPGAGREVRPFIYQRISQQYALTRSHTEGEPLKAARARPQRHTLIGRPLQCRAAAAPPHSPPSFAHKAKFPGERTPPLEQLSQLPIASASPRQTKPSCAVLPVRLCALPVVPATGLLCG